MRHHVIAGRGFLLDPLVPGPEALRRVGHLRFGAGQTDEAGMEGGDVFRHHRDGVARRIDGDEERYHTEIGRAHAELQSLMRTSYAVFCLKKKTNRNNVTEDAPHTRITLN